MATVTTIHNETTVRTDAAALRVLNENPQLVQALLDFKQNRLSGTLEIHFGQGGVGRIFATVQKTYK